MKVFVDTTPLYALVERRDQAHARAVELFKRASEARDSLYTPLPMAIELHGLLLKRKPTEPQAAHETTQAVLNAYPLVFPIDEDARRALEVLQSYKDQRISYADALLGSIALREGAQVMTFDRRHFELMGAQLYK